MICALIVNIVCHVLLLWNSVLVLVYIAWGDPDYTKRARPDSWGVVAGPFPQRPGEKMCAYYMTTSTCSFGASCRFDHPTWVPYGGIANWKEVCWQFELFAAKLYQVARLLIAVLSEVGNICVVCRVAASFRQAGALELIGPLKQSLIMCTQVTSGTPTDPASLPQRPGETVCAVSGLNRRHHFQLHLFSFCNQA